MQLDLTDSEAEALASFLRRTIQEDPLLPGLAPLRTVLRKLDPMPQQPPPSGRGRPYRGSVLGIVPPGVV